MSTKSSHQKAFWQRGVVRVVPMGIGVIILLLLLHFTNFSFEELYSTFIRIEGRAVLEIVLITWVWLMLVAYRWGAMVKVTVPRYRFLKGFFFYYSSLSVMAVYFLSQAVGNIGMKTLALKQEKNIPIATGSFIVVVEHLANLFFLSLFVLPAVLFACKLSSPSGALLSALVSVVGAFVGVFLWFSTLKRYFAWGVKAVGGFVSRFSWGKKARFLENIDSQRFDLLHRGLVLKLMVYSCIIYLIGPVRNYIFAEALGIEIPFVPLLLVFPFVYIVGLAGLTPGSLGITEVGWVGVLMLIGVEKDQALLFALSVRFLNIAAVLGVFLVSFCQYNLAGYWVAGHPPTGDN